MVSSVTEEGTDKLNVQVAQLMAIIPSERLVD